VDIEVFYFFLFSMSSFQVLTRSPSFECVPPDVPDSTTLVFAQSGHLFTYIGGPKGIHSIFQRNFCFGERSSVFFGRVMDQSKWLTAKKNSSTC